MQPSDCKTQWKTTAVSASAVNGTTFRTPAMISEPAATCYPSGWDEASPKSRLSFSPGVCPQGWVYNAMAESGSQVESTAFCCPRFGRTLSFFLCSNFSIYFTISVFLSLLLNDPDTHCCHCTLVASNIWVSRETGSSSR